MADFDRLAIVNRGEPATRALRAATEFAAERGRPLTTIALFTDPDAHAWYVRQADEAVHLGPATVRGDAGRTRHTYLDHDRLLAALGHARADAVWVGWGFVAEDADFAEACERAGIVFVGPTSDVMRRLGDKIRAKQVAEAADVPVLPWSGRAVEDLDDAREAADTVGYPLVVKASAGGGGRGIRRVRDAHGLEQALKSAQEEAALAFGDPRVFLERMARASHHVEVQVVADHHGTVWPLGARDCSLQRRNQKILEEAAGVSVPVHVRDELLAAGARLAAEVGYRNAGTVEFLFDPEAEAFHFLEVNTRLQVEHPVTELTTRTDIVKLQLHIAGGGRLEGEPPPEVGHAIEVRVNAEDPERGFSPSPGRVSHLRLPAGPGIRVDAGIVEGETIAPEFDSMIAKILAWGRDRSEALARLRRALSETVVVVDGGVTNKAFLQTLLDRDEVVAGEVDTGWLDRLAETGDHLPRHHGACLVAAALEAYAVDHAERREHFIRTAARGRPEASEDDGHRVELRFRGETYPLTVHMLSPGTYRVETSDGLVEVTRQELGSHERRLVLGDRTVRVIAAVQGPTYLLEVDGVPHRIERDDGGFVRSPAPAVVVSFEVDEGDEVDAGQPLAILESMKMETTVAAPFSGRVRRLIAAANAQVDAGAALLQVEPVTDDDQGTTERIVFELPEASFVTDPETGAEAYRALLAVMHGYLLGYDLDRSAVERLYDDLAGMASLPAEDAAGAVPLEVGILDVYADLGQLSRRTPPPEEVEDLTGASPHEYLLTYLRSIERPAERLPERFVERLRAALARYGVTSLDHTPELEETLFWMYRAFLRLPEVTSAIAAILDRWRVHPEQIVGAVGFDDLRRLLDRVIDAAEGRSVVVGDLAREVQFGAIDEPLLDAARDAVTAEMDEVLVALRRDPDRPDREALIQRLLDCPQPIRPLLLRHALESDDPRIAEIALRVRLRRYYRLRPLRGLRSEQHDGVVLGVGTYEHEDRRFHLVASYARRPDLDRVLRAVAAHLAGLDTDDPTIVDLTLAASGPLRSPDDVGADIRAAVTAVDLGRPLHRLDTTLTFEGDQPEHARTVHLSHRHRDGELVEDRLYRNLHPMLAKRIGLWRLENFEIERLPSAEDVYLFRATARDNPSDRRLFAFAEVRDLTPALDRDGTVVGLPLLERLVLESFEAMRRHLSPLPPRERPVQNRVVLFVRPPVTVPPDRWREIARRVAPSSLGVGLEKVVLRVLVPDPSTGDLRDVDIHVENLGQRGLVVRAAEPLTEAIPTRSAYEQKVLKTEQRGGVYPYELVRRLTPEAGTASDFPHGRFVEHDLDPSGERLEPVDRAPGGNSANLVVGTIVNHTDEVPEGMERVIILGDPSSSLGSLAEPECRRVNAALDLAEERRIPVEWYAVSSGARIAMDSGTENMDWIAATLRRIITFTQAGGEINVVVTGINVGAQPYWNAEATMLMHTRGILVMTPASAMVLTGKQALDFSGGVSAEDNFGIGGFDRIMGPNGQGQYWVPTVEAAGELLLRHYEHTYVVPGERFPRRAPTRDDTDRDIRDAPHRGIDGSSFSTVGQIFSSEHNPERKKPFDIRSVMRAVTDQDREPLERWHRWRDAETVVVWDARLGGIPVCLLGIESHPVPRESFAPADGPGVWTSGTLFPQSSRKAARAINSASGNRPVVVLANLSGFDGSPESMRDWQLEYGAEIGRAVANFDGPIVFCVVSRYHGGAFVVFSKPLNPHLEIAAVEGSYASVIGGTPAAAVVFAREVDARTESDARVVEARRRVAEASDAESGRRRAELDRVREEVHAAKIGEVADEFDSVHSIERAQAVGSVDHIIAPARLRPYLVEALERGMAAVTA